jgi:hypothetical protein
MTVQLPRSTHRIVRIESSAFANACVIRLKTEYRPSIDVTEQPLADEFRFQRASIREAGQRDQ